MFNWIFDKRVTRLPAYSLTPKQFLEKFRFYSNHPKWHPKNFPELRQLARKNEDAVYELMFSSLPTKKEKDQLLTIGGSDISCERKNNRKWHGFFKRLRKRQGELPQGIQSSLDWYLKAHGW